jgi:hypothetical protein
MLHCLAPTGKGAVPQSGFEAVQSMCQRSVEANSVCLLDLVHAEALQRHRAVCSCLQSGPVTGLRHSNPGLRHSNPKHCAKVCAKVCYKTTMLTWCNNTEQCKLQPQLPLRGHVYVWLVGMSAIAVNTAGQHAWALCEFVQPNMPRQAAC